MSYITKVSNTEKILSGADRGKRPSGSGRKERNDMKKTVADDALLMKYMQGLCSDREKEFIGRWLEESEENVKAFTDAHHIYENVLMSVDPSRLRMPAAGKKRKPAVKIMLAGISIAASIAAAAVFSWHQARLSASEERIVAEVPAGKMMTLTLGDGTMVDLNSGARLEYPAVFYGRHRDVSLEGEAMFHVSKDKSRPFTVKTFAADIKVLGTQFNVLADKESGTFLTSLVEGSIEVKTNTSPEQCFILVPDQTIVLDGTAFEIEDRLDPQTLYWTKGLINIAGIGFDELMERFRIAFDADIVMERDELPVIECTSGEIRISDGIEQAFRILQHVADFSYTKEGPGKYVIK